MAAVPVPDPARRGIRRSVSNDELKSPIQAMGYETPERTYATVSPGHFVQMAWGGKKRVLKRMSVVWNNAAARTTGAGILSRW